MDIAMTKTSMVVLGSTGSIGEQTLDIVSANQQLFHVHALTAHRNVAKLLEQCLVHEPDIALLVDTGAAKQLAEQLKAHQMTTKVLSGERALRELAASPEATTVVSAIVGAKGLAPNLAALKAGKRLVLANKESLVMAGEIMMETCSNNGAQIIPVDSEHNAVYQCMPAGYVPGIRAESVNRVTLTASGGPFRDWSYKAMAEATPEQAVAHPNWSMGAKISVDSATMMNKGLEIIEASWLFDMPVERIDALVHPQSLVHALVEYIDSTVLAQLAVPDMRVPISHALSCPDRLPARAEFLQLAQKQQLTFEPVDQQRFPCLQLAYEALKIGGSAPAVLNAVNEVAVDAFLRRSISFTDIAEIAHKTMESMSIEKIEDIGDVMVADNRARCYASEIIEQTT